MNAISPTDLFDFASAKALRPDPFPLFFLGKALEKWVKELVEGSQPSLLDIHPSAVVEGTVVGEVGSAIGPGAYVQGPVYLAKGAQVRHGAFVRGPVYLGPDAVVGHATEVKASYFFDRAKAPHFNYVGDSILGIDVNLGAGTKLANLRFDHQLISYRDPQTKEKGSSGLKKWGALIGDRAQTGCNAVLSPGSILLPGSWVLYSQKR